MSQERSERGRRVRRGRPFQVEVLEDRQLLASAAETFTGPSLAPLIRQAWNGKDTSRVAIHTMLKALQTQLTNGPLADLKAGAVSGDGFVTEVQNLVASYNANVDQQLLPHFANVDEMLKLQGLRIVDTMAALNQVNTVGLSTDSEFVTSAQTAIDSLTKGPMSSLGTPLSGLVTTTQTFESAVRTVINNVSALSLEEANATLFAQAEAYRSSMLAGLLITHTDYAVQVNTAIDTFERTVTEITSSGGSTVEALLNRALVAFDSAILDTSGLFGSTGYAGLANAKYGYLPHQAAAGRTATTVTDVGGAGVFGGTATVTATVTAADGTAVAGQTVNFIVDGVYAGTAMTDSSGLATLSGVPIFAASGTSTGAVWASFAGSAKNRGSTGTGDLVVSQSSTTTALVSSANPSSLGASVTFTATVTPTASGSGAPTGTVTFKDGSTTLGTGALNSSGVATFSTTGLTVGTHSITAVYEGDSDFTSSTSAALSQVVNPATSTTLSSNVNPSVSGQSVTFTATVAPTSGSGTPTGTVTFRDGSTTLGTGTLNGSGVATFSTGSLTVATHSITAVYGGDANFGSSTSTALSQVVNPASTSTALTPVPNPSVFGQAVTLTATVSAVSPGAGTPTGTVTFKDGSTTLGTGTLNSLGVASFSTSSLIVGTHSITAEYGGSTNFNASTSAPVTQTVNQASTTTALTSSLNPSNLGQPVTFTATVSVVLPGTGTPTGTVEFFDGASSLGSGLLNSSRVASIVIDTLDAGSHAISAVYAGDPNYLSSTSPDLTQTVNAAP